MLIEPASNVSVPFTVVIRNLSRVPDIVLDPEPEPTEAEFEVLVTALNTQSLVSVKCKVKIPLRILAALAQLSILNPVELIPTLGDAPEIEYIPLPLYPAVSILPDPIRHSIFDVPFVLTPLNITVILLVPLGIPVKSIDVPLVEATAVPEFIPGKPVRLAPLIAGKSPVNLVASNVLVESSNVPLLAGKVMVLVPATAGASIVIDPLVFPFI